MHVLVTNDDGPPSPTSSPYVHSLVRALQKAGHNVSVCLPSTQRSWIGKAHIIGQTVKPTYYRPPQVFDPNPSASTHQGTVHTRPSKSENVEEWILADGTPASCAQLGLYHFFKNKGPIDLVISGPNFGRNTTAVFALSSGTLGGALEAAVCRRKAVALSYAFFPENKHDPATIEATSAHSVKVIEKIFEQWPTDGSVDLYSINVPLVKDVAKNRVLFAEILQNTWGDGSPCFLEGEGSVGDEDEEEERIREGEGRSEGQSGQDSASSGHVHRHFKWQPTFEAVYKSVRDSKPGNDGWAVQNGVTSITPLRANFWHAAPHLHGQELKMDSLDSQHEEPSTAQKDSLVQRPKNHFHALIAYEDPYVQPLIISALEKTHSPASFTLLKAPVSQSPELEHSEISLDILLPAPDTPILQITPYEAIDWDFVSGHERTCLVNSYMLRKALIRKHYLASTIENWVAKRPASILKDHVQRGEAFEVDYAEFLDDALVDAFELRASLERNETEGEDGTEKETKEREWWILKPGMSDRGQGIRLFSTMEELQGIFDEWEAERTDSEDEDGEDDDEPPTPQTQGKGHDGDDDKAGDYITTSHLRHFVAQPYIHPPLLIPSSGNRKFHIRTYVLSVGSLDVYVYRPMLALFAGKPYVAPWDSDDLEAHLTNTCLQRSVSDGTVQQFWDIDLPTSGNDGSPSKEGIFAQICSITGEVFEAAARGMMMHFQTLPNAFEVYGLDFLVDSRGTAWLLEVNAFPDFKQTGDELQSLVAGLWEGVMEVGVKRFFAGDETKGSAENGGGTAAAVDALVHVRNVDLGRRWGTA
ncbi:survival protein sure-like phosphatase/nucleotidase [Xylariales sp. PMI_506]|nr:survival protein sure-like phosphatase/nucleotidase [Xylariales sp. PMI_506]